MKCSLWTIAYFGIFLVMLRGTCGTVAPQTEHSEESEQSEQSGQTGRATAVACTHSTELELKTFPNFKRGLDACTIITYKIWIYIYRRPKYVYNIKYL